MSKLLSVAMALICGTAVTAQETKPTPPATTKSKPVEKAAEAKAAGATSVEFFVVPAQGWVVLKEGKVKTGNKTVEAEALEAKLRHIAHLASQAAHTFDLDVIEKKLVEIEKELVDARAKLWKARDAETRPKSEKLRGKREEVKERESAKRGAAG